MTLGGEQQAAMVAPVPPRRNNWQDSHDESLIRAPCLVARRHLLLRVQKGSSPLAPARAS
jgi:hypothetical protein